MRESGAQIACRWGWGGDFCIQNPKRVFTYEMLLDLVWHENYTYYSRKAINNHVSNLRKKIRIAPDLPDYVKSVYGVGYKFDI